jgi:Tfp pilus assembly protein PilN
MCLALFVLVMAGLIGSFATIKIRQRSLWAKEKLVNDKMTRMQMSIQQFEELQSKRKEMMKTALTTAELLEPVPRSVLLASLTNNLPPGTSLLEVKLEQKVPTKRRRASSPQATSNYQAAKAGQPNEDSFVTSQEKHLETSIEINGMAPSDLQVASYIERLACSNLLTNVALVESKEYKVEESLFRQFKLKAMLTKDVHLSTDDVERIRAMAQKSVYNF